MSMFRNFINRLFDNDPTSSTSANRKRRRRTRTLRIEQLESREMLSVTFEDFLDISSKYTDLDLGDTQAAYESYNIIEIEVNNLSEEALRSALTSAAGSTEDDIIVIRTSSTQNNIALGGTELAININTAQYGSITLVSLGTTNLTIDANEQSRIFSVTNGTKLMLGGLTLTKGQVGANEGGGAIYNAGSLTVTECTITENMAIAGSSSHGGGGIYNYSYATLTIINSTIVGNESSYYGGGINNYRDATLVINNSTISENSTARESAGHGGGIYNSGYASVTNSAISENWVSSSNWVTACGGGIYNGGNGVLSIANSTISENRGGFGGGTCNTSTGTLTITDCTISKNTVGTGAGGGIYNIDTGMLTITNSTIEKNTARFGGGIYNHATMVVNNSTISGNSAGANGGGFYNDAGTLTAVNCVVSGNNRDGIYNTNDGASVSELTVTNCTIVGNTGYGINSPSAPLTINNSIVACNDIRGSRDIYTYDGVTISGSNNLVGNGIGNQVGQSEIVDGVNGNIIGTAENPVDARFARFSSYTVWSDILWQTWDLHLIASSPAIDAGSNDIAVDAEGNPLLYDLDGNHRIANETVDIGAYEYGSTKPTQPLTVPPLGNVTATGANSISVSWGAVENASGYRIEYTTDENFEEHILPLTVDDGTATTDTIHGLPPNTTYYVRVIAIGTGKYSDSEWSDVKSAKTDSPPVDVIPLLPPESITVIAKGTDTITVSWNEVNDAIGYVIEYSVDKDFEHGTVFEYEVDDGSITTADVRHGLAPNTTYYFRIKAVGEGVVYSDSEWSSDKVSANIDEIVPTTTPLAVTMSVRATSSDATTIAITWNAVDNAAGYRIEYTVDVDFKQNIQTENASGTSIDITGLTTGTRYYVRVIAIGSGEYNDSQHSSIVSAVPTATPTEPVADAVKASGVKKSSTLTSITLTWKVNANNAEYVIKCTSHPSLDIEYVTSDNAVTIIGLSAGTSYKFSITAVNADGKTVNNKGKTTAVNVSAKTTKYTAVKSLKRTSIGLHSVALTWKEPAKVKDNPTTGYTVRVLEVNGKITTDVTDLVQVGTINGNNTGSGQGTASVKITGLSDKTKYRIEVQAVADGLGGVKSAIARINVTTLNPAKYPAVAGFKATVDKNTNAVNLSWTESKVPETIGYEVEIRDANGQSVAVSGVTDALVLPTDTGKVTLTPIAGLEPGKYTILVRAVAEGGIVKSVKDAKKSVTVKA